MRATHNLKHIQIVVTTQNILTKPLPKKIRIYCLIPSNRVSGEIFRIASILKTNANENLKPRTTFDMLDRVKKLLKRATEK